MIKIDSSSNDFIKNTKTSINLVLYSYGEIYDLSNARNTCNVFGARFAHHDTLIGCCRDNLNFKI